MWAADHIIMGLRRHFHSSHRAFVHLNAVAEIRDLDVSLTRYQNIVTLDVSMDPALRMQKA